MYRPYKGHIKTVGIQQWLIMQHTKRKDHPRQAAIIDIIISINKKTKGKS